MKIGVLTGGGDCPGLNPAIRGVVLRALEYGDELIGLRQGWKGLVEALTTPLTLEIVEPIINQGGTILESSRTNPVKDEKMLAACLKNAKELGLDALIALGGEDTLGVANKLTPLGINCVGVPKTMDNDLNATDYTFGFNSATEVATEAADRLKDTAKSHRRVMVLEVMGRHAGWVALHTGVAAGADYILIPEVPMDLEAVANHMKQVIARGKNWGLIVVSEGVELTESDTENLERDAFGHIILSEQGVGEFIAKEIKQRVGIETRHVVLGHVVRGGAPSAYDRVLGTRVGIKAVEMVHAGQFGHMAALRGTDVIAVPLEAAVEQLKTVPVALYEEVKTLFSR